MGLGKRLKSKPRDVASSIVAALKVDECFEPTEIERSWYDRWVANNYFSAGRHVQTGTGAPYVIQFPPPNVTGTLHMGHAFNHTIMDALVRWRRM